MSQAEGLVRSPVDGTDFLSLIAHELRQPLTAAIGSASILSGESAPALDIKMSNLLLEIIVRNLDQLSSLIESLRVFSDAEQGGLQVRPRLVAVDDLFREATEDFDVLRTKRKLRTHSPGGLVACVDLTVFRQVISNLVANAIKFSSDGSTIDISAKVHGSSLMISVRNEGEGFPASERERIFKKSVRLDRKARGLGLGLFVARAIVEAHGGRLVASSVPGSWAQFDALVPLSQTGPGDAASFPSNALEHASAAVVLDVLARIISEIDRVSGGTDREATEVGQQKVIASLQDGSTPPNALQDGLTAFLERHRLQN
jgi:two-component system, OmpR family, sensor histidine kinase KdpD